MTLPLPISQRRTAGWILFSSSLIKVSCLILFYCKSKLACSLHDTNLFMYCSQYYGVRFGIFCKVGFIATLLMNSLDLVIL